MKTLLVIFSKKGIQKIIFESSHESILGIKGGMYSWATKLKHGRPRNTSPLSYQKHLSAKIQKQFSDYFSGKLKKFTLLLDPQGTKFDLAVWKATQKIPYGQVRSYKDIATILKKPLTSRAVGNALGRNPIPILIPCHRVIASDGTLGGYSSGLKIKKMLLALEHYSERVRYLPYFRTRST